MFKKIEELGSLVQQNKSNYKQVRQQIQKQYPNSSTYIEQLFPKSDTMQLQKLKSEYKTELIHISNKIKFFSKEKSLFPILHILHQYPDMLPRFQVDTGAIKFVLSGANIMAPGLTSKGGKLPEQQYPVGTIVSIYAENKENAIAIGMTVQSTDDIKSLSKGIAVENIHFMGDALWVLNAGYLADQQAQQQQQQQQQQPKTKSKQK